jgi:hypothetical protein
MIRRGTRTAPEGPEERGNCNKATVCTLLISGLDLKGEVLNSIEPTNPGTASDLNSRPEEKSRDEPQCTP